MSAPVQKQMLVARDAQIFVSLDVLQLILASVIRDGLPEIKHIRALALVNRFWWRALRLMSLYKTARDDRPLDGFIRTLPLMSWPSIFPQTGGSIGNLRTKHMVAERASTRYIDTHLHIFWRTVLFYLEPKDIAALKCVCEDALSFVKQHRLERITPSWKAERCNDQLRLKRLVSITPDRGQWLPGYVLCKCVLIHPLKLHLYSDHNLFGSFGLGGGVQECLTPAIQTL